MPDMSAREFIAHHTSLILDSTEELSTAAKTAALEAILDDMGTGDTLQGYRDMLAGRIGGFEHWEYARAAGARIRDLTFSLVRKAMPRDSDPMALLFAALLDYGDEQMWTGVGNYFLPEAEDLPGDED